MFSLPKKFVFAAVLAGLLALSVTTFLLRHNRESDLPRDAIARAVATSDPQLLEKSVAERMDVNARDAEGRTPLSLATERGDHALIDRLLGLGADVETARSDGLTPLIIASAAGDLDSMRIFLEHHANTEAVDAVGCAAVHHAVASRQADAVEVLLRAASSEDPDLLAMACETEEPSIIRAVLSNGPTNLEWTAQTRRALENALANGEHELTRLLITKHAVPPTVAGRNVPFLAQAIVDDNTERCRDLIEAGLDLNAALPVPADKDFLKTLPSDLRDYVKGDEGITPLMIAAGTGRTEIVRMLLEAGASRNRMTKKYKMLALYFAVHTEKYRAVQMLLGSGPLPEELRIEISLTAQRASVIKDGAAIFQTQCSTGRDGFATPAGKYVITDKKRDHVSSIYKVAMPYFMRLNCRDFGMHEGVVPNRPASHGCIRLPSAAAKKLFAEIPIGTVVTIN